MRNKINLIFNRIKGIATRRRPTVTLQRHGHFVKSISLNFVDIQWNNKYLLRTFMNFNSILIPLLNDNLCKLSEFALSVPIAIWLHVQIVLWKGPAFLRYNFENSSAWSVWSFFISFLTRLFLSNLNIFCIF